MRRMGTASTCFLLAFSTAVGPGPTCGGAEIEDLGVAVRAVVYGNSHGCLAQSPSGQPGMFYIPYFTTTGGALVGIHPQSGEHVHVPLPSKGGYGTAVGADGAIYVGR